MMFALLASQTLSIHILKYFKDSLCLLEGERKATGMRLTTGPQRRSILSQTCVGFCQTSSSDNPHCQPSSFLSIKSQLLYVNNHCLSRIQKRKPFLGFIFFSYQLNAFFFLSHIAFSHISFKIYFYVWSLLPFLPLICQSPPSCKVCLQA